MKNYFLSLFKIISGIFLVSNLAAVGLGFPVLVFVFNTSVYERVYWVSVTILLLLLIPLGKKLIGFYFNIKT